MAAARNLQVMRQRAEAAIQNGRHVNEAAYDLALDVKALLQETNERCVRLIELSNALQHLVWVEARHRDEQSDETDDSLRDAARRAQAILDASAP